MNSVDAGSYEMSATFADDAKMPTDITHSIAVTVHGTEPHCAVAHLSISARVELLKTIMYINLRIPRCIKSVI